MFWRESYYFLNVSHLVQEKRSRFGERFRREIFFSSFLFYLVLLYLSKRYTPKKSSTSRSGLICKGCPFPWIIARWFFSFLLFLVVRPETRFETWRQRDAAVFTTRLSRGENKVENISQNGEISVELIWLRSREKTGLEVSSKVNPVYRISSITIEFSFHYSSRAVRTNNLEIFPTFHRSHPGYKKIEIWQKHRREETMESSSSGVDLRVGWTIFFELSSNSWQTSMLLQ